MLVKQDALDGKAFAQLCVVLMMTLMITHGGGEGRAPIGRPSPMSPWGKPTLGKTRRGKNLTNLSFVDVKKNNKTYLGVRRKAAHLKGGANGS